MFKTVCEKCGEVGSRYTTRAAAEMQADLHSFPFHPDGWENHYSSTQWVEEPEEVAQ